MSIHVKIIIRTSNKITQECLSQVTTYFYLFSENLSPPFPQVSSCSLLPSPEGTAEISLRWLSSQHVVERYRVSVNPDPSSCSSDQVSPSEDYSCCGLVLGTHYTFTVSAINCGDWEGERNVFNISNLFCG